MRINLLAKRYAQALFDLALEQKIEDKIVKDMYLVKSVLEENRELSRILSNPVISDQKKIKILEAIFKKEINRLTLEFFKLLLKKNRETYLHAICVAYIDIHMDYNNILPLTFVTAFKTNKATKDAVIKKVIEATKKKVEVEEVIDDDIVGGFILNYGDYQYDASIKTQLNKLYKRLSNNL